MEFQFNSGLIKYLALTTRYAGTIYVPQKQSVTRTTFIIKTTFVPLVDISVKKKLLTPYT